jgi:hypothetical protein
MHLPCAAALWRSHSQQALTTQQALSLGGVAMLLPGLVLEPGGHSYAWSPAWAGCVSPHVAGMACEYMKQTVFRRKPFCHNDLYS